MIISVDAGSSSLRSILFDENAKNIYCSQVQYAPFTSEEGCNEQKSSVFQDALFYTLSEVADFAKAHSYCIDAISVTSQRSSVFAIQENGNVLCNTMTWHDKRSVCICESLKKQEKAIFSKTGLRLNPMFSAPKMAWLKEFNKDVYNKAYKLIGVHEYMLYSLCNKFVTDNTIASRTMLQDLNTLKWDKELIDIFGLDIDKLCENIPQGSVCGELSEFAQKKCGLKAGIPVVTAGGDQQCSALGLGIVKSGQMEVTTGTGAYVVTISDKPVIDEHMRFLCNVSALKGLYVLEAPILTAGNVYRWFGEFCFKEYTDKKTQIEKINEYAQSSQAGANGLTILPFFKGSGAPKWDVYSKGCAIGLTLDTTKGDFARGILEGIAFEICKNIDVIESVYKKSEYALKISGGLTKFALYNQIIADITSKEVAVSDDSESTALGAWICAVNAINKFSVKEGMEIVLKDNTSKVFKPNKQSSEVYKDLKAVREQYEDYYS